MEQVPPGYCYIRTVAVDKRFRGNGIGAKLLKFADEEAIKNNCNVRIARVVITHKLLRRKLLFYLLMYRRSFCTSLTTTALSTSASAMVTRSPEVRTASLCVQRPVLRYVLPS